MRHQFHSFFVRTTLRVRCIRKQLPLGRLVFEPEKRVLSGTFRSRSLRPHGDGPRDPPLAERGFPATFRRRNRHL